MEQPNQSGDRHDRQHRSHPGRLTSDEAPRERQQDQLSGDCGPSAPPPTTEDPSGYQKKQQPECGHQDRHPDTYYRTGHADLPDLQRRVRQGT